MSWISDIWEQIKKWIKDQGIFTPPDPDPEPDPEPEPDPGPPPSPDPPPPKPDPDPVPPPPGPPPPAHPEIVSEVTGQSFMSIAKLSNGQILIGCYSFPDKYSLLFCLGHSDPIARLYTGESIFRIREFDGFVHLICEKQVIYRDALRSNPAEYAFTKWMTLKTGPHSGAYDCRKVLGQVVGVGGGEIRTNGRTTKSWTDRYYVKQVLEFRNQALVPGWNNDTMRGGWFESPDAHRWTWRDKAPKYSRLMVAEPDANTGERLFFGGSSNFREWHNPDSAAVWQYDPAGGLVHLFTFEGYDFCAAVCHAEGAGHVDIGLTRRWKGREPGAQLVSMSAAGVHPVALFDEAEIRGIVADGPYRYIATRTDRVRGRVYRVKV